VEALFLYWTVMFGLAGLGIIKPTLESPPGQVEASERVVYLFSAGFAAFIVTIAKLMTIHHCRRFIRNFIPKE